MRKSKGTPAQPPAPKGSRLSPSPSRIPKKIPAVSAARSAEDIPRRVHLSCSTELTPLRSMSPGSNQGSRMGVRYITEDLIKKTAKQDNLALITTLSLTLSNDIGKKIKYIENLESLKQLQVLNLSGNCIEKIEKLEKLTQLQELNLSFNNIRKVEGIENLVGLQVLNLTGNQIEHIPSWLGKRLKSLRVFKIAKNNLVSLNELSRLKILPDLVQLSLADNPLSELPHSRAYVIFHIRTLEILDGQPISAMDRSKAKERFSMEEVINLEKALDSQEAKNQKLEEDHGKFIKEFKQVESDYQNSKKKEQETSNRIKELEQELQTKNDLLKKKTKELHRACEKHYQLEQELAFYKIDAKFANLGDEPVADQTLDTDDNEPLIESPYIGKALFKPSQFAKEVQNSAKAQKSKLITPSQNDDITNTQNFILQQKKEQAELDSLLQEKQQEIESANDSLKKLQETLVKTEAKVKQAYDEFQRVSNLIPRQSPDNEMKMIIRQNLADKMKRVNVFRNQAGVLEKEINKAEKSVEENREEMTNLKWQLQQLDSTDPTYKEIYGEMVEKEQQIYEDNEVSQRLQEQLGDMLETIATETANIRDLEQQLHQDVQPASPEAEELRQELGSVVTGLQTYLENVKDKNQKQLKHIEQLLSEREKLQDKVSDLTALLNNVSQDDQLMQKLKKHVAKTEEALLELQEFSAQLEKELEMKEEEEKDVQEQLKEAILNINDLKQELEDTERRAQAEIQSLEQQLIAEKENTLLSTKKAFVEAEKDRHFSKIIAELEKSKLLNSALKNELEENRKKFDRCINDYILPGDLKKKMKNLSHSLKTGKNPIEPENNKDFVGQIFQDLQKGLQDRMNRMKKEIDAGRQNEKKMIQQNQALMNKLDESMKTIEQVKKKSNHQKEMADAQFANDKERKLLQEEIKQLKKALEVARAEVKREKQKAFEKRVVYAPSESSEHDTMNSEERHLFDELQAELVDFKTKMKDKEDFLNQQLADADAKVTHWQTEAKKQQQFYQQELQKQQAENASHRVEQDAQTKVIAEDLQNARAMVNHFQDLLNQRQQQLMTESEQANMSDQMIASQEEELGHLYNILEAQREEIENLNNALNHLMHQNPEAMGPAYDDQLKQLQDKVGRLTKEIATQSSAVKGLPVSMSTNISPAFDVERSQSIPGILGTHHGPVISAEPSASKYNKYPSSLLPTHERNHATNMQEVGNVISPAGRTSRLPQNLNLKTGGHSIPVRGSAGHPSSVNISSQHPVITNRYVSPPAAQHFHPVSHSAELTTGLSSQLPLIPSTFDNMEQFNPPGNMMVQPMSTIMHPEHSAAPTQSFYPNNVLLQPEISGTNNQVVTESIHGPLTYHTSKVLEISPTLGGVSVAPPNQGVSNLTTNPITQTHTLPFTNVGTTGPTQKLISTRSQIQPSENVSSFVGGRQMVAPEISHSGMSSGHQTSSMQPVSYKVPSNSQQGSLVDNVPHQPVLITGSTATESRQPKHILTLPQEYQTEVRGFQPVMSNSSAPAQGQSFSGAQMLQRPSFNQEPQSFLYEPTTVQVSSGQSMGQNSQGPVLGQASPYRKSVAFQQPLVNYGPSTHHYPTNQSSTAPHSTFASDPSINAIPNPKSSQTYSPQVLRNKQALSLGQITPGIQALSNQQYAPPGNQLHHLESVSPGYPVVPGSPVAFSSPIDSPSSPVWTHRSHLGEQISPIKAGFNLQPALQRRTKENLEDEGKLFCNVPEHHSLEDYLTKLQDKIVWLKMKLKNLKQSKEVVTLNKGRKLICRLQEELEERRSELEGLDLAIERQKKNLKKIKIEESQLERERKIAKEELQYLKECNNRRIKRKYPFEQSFERQDFEDPSDSSFDEHASFCQQLRLQGEIKCLEKTLLKRQTQLKQVDLELKEYKQDIKSAKLQFEDAMRKYNDATHSLENTAQETMELERRANEVGVQVVTEAGHLKLIQAEYREMQRKKNRLEKVLNEINEVISQKDTEFQDIDNKMKRLNLSYMQLQKDLALLSHKERETTKSLLSSEELLLKKKAQINQLKEQRKSELLGLQTEKADVQLRERQAELLSLQQNLDQKKLELTSLLNDVQSEVSFKQRELKLQQEEVIKLEGQKLELVTIIHNKKGELLQLVGEVERNQNILSGLNTDTTKQKEAFQQITEQYKTSQSELSILKMQQEKKVEILENTSRHLQKVKSEMDSISLETNHRKEELELLSQSVQKERQELNHLSMERSALETQVQHLSDERNLLTDSNKKLDNQLNAMKKELNQIENKIRESKKSVDMMQVEIQSKQKNIENCQNTRDQLDKGLQDLKKRFQDEQEEYSTLQALIQKTQTEDIKLKQEVQEIHSEKAEAERILKQLTAKIEKSQAQQQNEFHQIDVYQEKLKELLCALEEKNSEMETISKHICASTQELESLHAELRDTKEQVQNLSNQVEPLQKSSLELQEIKTEKKEIEVEMKLLKEQKSSMEAHLEQLKKNISELYEEPLFDKEKLPNLILNNKQEWRKEALKERFLEEQDHLRLKLQQQMYRHVDVIEATRQQSEGFLHNLQHKLNVLQDVFITNNIGSPGTNSTNANTKKSDNLHSPVINQLEKSQISIEQMVPAKDNL